MSVTYNDPSDEPYDPDMTVQEALEAGLIVVLDSGATDRTYTEPCREPDPMYSNDDDPYVPPPRCTRAKGHDGVCAYVRRWEGPKQRAEALAQQKAALDALRGSLTEFGVQVATFGAQAMNAVNTPDSASRETRRFKPRMAGLKDAAKEDALEEHITRGSMVYGPTQRRDQAFKDKRRGGKR